MNPVTDALKHRHIRHCYKADPAYGQGVAEAMGIDINEVDLDVAD